MKINLKCLLNFSVLIGLSACSTPVIYKKQENPIKEDPYSFSRFYSAFYCLAPEAYEDLDSLPESKLCLLKGLSHLKLNGYDSALYYANRVLELPIDDTITYAANLIKNNVLEMTDNWDSQNDTTLGHYYLFLNNTFEIDFAETTRITPYNTQNRGHIIVPVNIDGVNYKFLFDSGFTFSAVTKSLAEKHDLPNPGTDVTIVGSTNDKSDAHFALLPEITLGGF